MSLEATIARIAQIQGMLAPPAPRQAPAPTASFSSALQTATPTTMTAAAPAAAGGTPAGQAMVNLARAEIGVTEQPPGSNESPRISQFRQATAGAPGPGPWCAYFVSWAAREAGVPIGDAGQGYGRVDDVWAWAERSGKAIPAAGAAPQPGDLIVWDEHIGIVESVGPNGTVNTIEGNSSDQVIRRQHAAGSALGYVRLG